MDMSFDCDRIYTSAEGVEYWLGEEPDDYKQETWDLVVNLTRSLPSPRQHMDGWRTQSVECPVLVFPFTDDSTPEYLPSEDSFRAFVGCIGSMVRLLENRKDKTKTPRVLFHCAAGINRSSFVLGLFLVSRHHLSPDEAISTIRQNRYPLCLCNTLFESKLREWSWA